MSPNFEIQELKEMKLVGSSVEMSFGNNTTAQLWRNFVPRKEEIKHRISSEMIAMQCYPLLFDFSPNTSFKKWATIEVSKFEDIPPEMETYVMQGGLYAIFHYKGSSTDPYIFQYIFAEWLPQSDYVVDNTRPHFELLGEKYKNNNPESEEDIYIPIKPNSQ